MTSHTRWLVPCAFAVLPVLAALSRPAAATTTTIWVGADGNCDTASLAGAIASASTSADDYTLIRVANTGQDYSNLNLSIINRNINLNGGYAHCHDSDAPGRTVVAGAPGGGSTMLVAASSTVRHVRVEHFELGGGSGGPGGYGGGLRISGNSSVLLYNVRIHDNQASYGGGIAILGSDGFYPTVTLHEGTLIGNSQSQHNEAAAPTRSHRQKCCRTPRHTKSASHPRPYPHHHRRCRPHATPRYPVLA